MTLPNSPSSFFELLEIIKTEFELKDAYMEEGIPTFIIASTPSFKEKIDKITDKLRQRGFGLRMRKSEVGIKLEAFNFPASPSQLKRFTPGWPLVLFVATVITVAISGYIAASGYIRILRLLGRIELEDEFTLLWSQTALYAISVIGIVGLHELGHTVACRINQVETSLPLFIPGIPGATPGTFGAIMMQKGPVLNRNQLFDIGFLGPFFGFVASLIVSFFGYSLSIPVEISDYQYVVSLIGPSQYIHLPFLFSILEPYIFVNSSSIYFIHPLALAGWMGTLITFLNTFPIGQLDGGHVARAVLNAKWYRRLSYIVIIVMFLAGWWTMALLVLLFVRFEHPGTLDDVSPLSKNRKILALVFVIMFIACFTLSPDSPLSLIL